jgi:hypothetical protein
MAKRCVVRVVSPRAGGFFLLPANSWRCGGLAKGPRFSGNGSCGGELAETSYVRLSSRKAACIFVAHHAPGDSFYTHCETASVALHSRRVAEAGWRPPPAVSGRTKDAAETSIEFSNIKVA